MYRDDSTRAMSHIRAASEIALAADDGESTEILAFLMETVNLIAGELRESRRILVHSGPAHGQAA